MKSKVVKNRPTIMIFLLLSSMLVFTLYFYSVSSVAVTYPPEPQGEPVADAGPDQSVNVEESVTFDGSASYDPDGYIISYSWDFDDEYSEFIGSEETKTSYTGAGVNPTHTYTVEGTYIVTLTVTDNNGLTSTDTMTVTVGTDSDEDENTLPILPIVAFLTAVALGVLMISVLTKKE